MSCQWLANEEAIWSQQSGHALWIEEDVPIHTGYLRISHSSTIFQTSKAPSGGIFLRTAQSDSTHLLSVLRTTVLSYCRNAEEDEMYNAHQNNHFDCRL